MDWKEIENTLQKEFEFTNFNEALEFVNKCGKIFESINHHPDISILRYKFVFISTTTHDAGNTITQLDKDITQKIDGLI